MQPTISVEEFQRFQTQLLDLREAQIQATDARIQAESRAKHLEAQLTELKAALATAQSSAHQDRVNQLLRDNAQIRDKLLSTESAFQLQSSTLRAECLHLSSEVDRLKALVDRPRHDRIVQTELGLRTHALVQTEIDEPPTIPRTPSPPPVSQEALEAIREVEDRIDALAGCVTKQLETKLSQLEYQLQTEVDALQSRIAARDTTEANLVAELNTLRQCVKQAQESEQTARNQLVSVKQRSEKLHRELRRQLTRLVRGTTGGDVERSSLRKLSIYSSSSSLSSVTNLPGAPGSVVNGEGTGMMSRQPQNEALDGSSDIPAGFFPVADFKALVNRLSEVQEENCSLRRQVQRLDTDLAAKTRALQIEMSKRLASADSHSTNKPSQTGPVIQPINSSHVDGNIVSNSNIRGVNSIFTPISSMFSTILKTHPDPTTLSSANLDTVNRLKRMCEDLLTENMRLAAQLEAAQKSSS